MSLRDVTRDAAYQKITADLLRSACNAVEIDVSSVEFGDRDQEASYAWLCFLVDPASEDRGAMNSASSATDHFDLMDPNGFKTKNAGSQVAITVHAIEMSDEASITIRNDDGQPVLTSPWVSNLAVARAKFTYR